MYKLLVRASMLLFVTVDIYRRNWNQCLYSILWQSQCTHL